MPRSIALFEWLAYLALALGLLSLYLFWPVTSAAFAANPTRYILRIVAVIAVQPFLIFGIARKRSNLLRWFWIAIVVAELLSGFEGRHVFYSVAAMVDAYLIYGLNIVAAVLLLLPDARVWFRQPEISN